MGLIRVLLLVTLYSVCGASLGQDPDSVAISNPHQIGMEAGKFTSVFKESSNQPRIIYRFQYGKKMALRAGLTIDEETGDSGEFESIFRLGLDRTFKRSENWSFYYGLDLYYQQIIIRSSDRTTNRMGAFSFIGAQYRIGSHFSISAEPTLSLLKVKFIDEDSFSNQRTDWLEIRNGNVGKLLISFHF